MALKATIYKATVNVADMDRNVFIDNTLTLARHPSETAERMMLRLLAWMVHANERLAFTRGLSAEDEPEVWQLNDHNGIDVWIELGLPDERRIKKPVAVHSTSGCMHITGGQLNRGGGSSRINWRSTII